MLKKKNVSKTDRLKIFQIYVKILSEILFQKNIDFKTRLWELPGAILFIFSAGESIFVMFVNLFPFLLQYSGSVTKQIGNLFLKIITEDPC